MNALLPVAIIFFGAFIAFAVASAVKYKGLAGSIISSVTMLVALYLVFIFSLALHSGAPVVFPMNLYAFVSYLRFDNLSVLLSSTVLILGTLVSIFSYRYMEHDKGQEKFYALLLIMVGAIVGLSASHDLFNIWIFFEVMCVSSYILVSFRKDRWEPLEAGFKYLIMSATGSMMVLLAISMMFGISGTLDISAIRQCSGMLPILPITAATVLFIAGFAVKAAIVPFHSWLPDAHSEAPSGISAMLSGIVIEAGLFAMIRVLLAVTGKGLDTGLVLIILAVITMFVGNIMALVQTKIKRMLAYSSVAQMGYIVLGIGIGMHYMVPEGFVGGLFHIVTHAGMKGLAFLVAGLIIHYAGTTEIAEMKGFAKKAPVAALCFAIAVLGLAGVPPLSGFMSKWIIYKSGIAAGGWGFALAGVAILNSVISLGYYVPVLNMFYSQDQSAAITNMKKVPFSVMVPVVLLALSVIALGVYPDFALRIVTPAVRDIYVTLGVLQ